MPYMEGALEEWGTLECITMTPPLPSMPYMEGALEEWGTMGSWNLRGYRGDHRIADTGVMSGGTKGHCGTMGCTFDTLRHGDGDGDGR